MSEAIAYTVRNFIDGKKMKEDLHFSPHNLNDAMIQQASMIAHYGELAADAARQVDSLKMLLESAEAVAYQTIRKDIIATGERVTEAQLEKMVVSHKSVVGLKRALADARRVEAVTKSAVEGFRHRRDMLIQLGAQARAEMQGELRTMGHSTMEDARRIASEGAINAARSLQTALGN